MLSRSFCSRVSDETSLKQMRSTALVPIPHLPVPHHTCTGHCRQPLLKIRSGMWRASLQLAVFCAAYCPDDTFTRCREVQFLAYAEDTAAWRESMGYLSTIAFLKFLCCWQRAVQLVFCLFPQDLFTHIKSSTLQSPAGDYVAVTSRFIDVLLNDREGLSLRIWDFAHEPASYLARESAAGKDWSYASIQSAKPSAARHAAEQLRAGHADVAAYPGG